MGFVGPYKTTVRKIVHQTATLLDLDSAQMKADVRRGFAGEAYGVPTDECLEAIKLLARLEGMVLDPVYKVKALAGRSIWHAVSCAKRDVSYSFIWEGLRLSARTRLSINNRGHSQEREVFAAEVFDWRLENFAPGAVAARMKRGTTAEQTRGDEGIS